MSTRDLYILSQGSDRAAPEAVGLWKDRQTRAQLAHSPGWANAAHALALWEL